MPEYYGLDEPTNFVQPYCSFSPGETNDMIEESPIYAQVNKLSKSE